MWWKKKLTKAERVEQELRKAGKAGVTNGRLNKITFRYGAVIFNLRHAGYKIDTVKIGGQGLYKFYWRGKIW